MVRRQSVGLVCDNRGERMAVGQVPSRPNQILGLDLASSNLAILSALLDILNQFLLLVLQLGAFSV